MPFGSSQWMYASGGFYNGVATQSLRLNPADTLTKTYTTPTSSKIMSFGGWVKKQKTGKYSNLYSGSLGGAGVPQGFIYFNNTNDKLECFSYTGSSYVFNYATTRVFRDVGSWYHVWVQIDTTDATQADRVKIYVNGIRETSFSTETQVGSGSPDVRALNESGITQYFGHTNSFYGGDVYYSDWYFIDGSAVSPVDTVGEFKNGVFIAKSYSPTFGNNGWHLEFNQTGTGTASSSTIGADTSGNANHFTSSGIVASDCDMPDSPENNFCTWNPLSNTGVTLANGNLETSGGAFDVCGGTIAVTSGKWYWECTLKSTVDLYNPVVIAFVSANTITHGINYEQGVYFYTDNGSNKIIGHIENNSATQNITVPSAMLPIAVDDVMQFAYDGDTGKIWFGINNVWADNSGGTTGNPSTGANPTFTLADTSIFMTPLRDHGGVAWTGHANFGQLDYDYTAPTDFNPLSTANLPEPTISPNAGTNKQSDDYFNTVLWTGTGATQSITGVGFQPDFVWAKSRSHVYHNGVFDVIRGPSAALYTSLTNAEGTESGVTSFDSDGFSLGTSNGFNLNGGSMVAWNWKAGGTAVSNTDGSITSSVSANTDAGTSILTYTGNGSAGATVGHALGATPKMVIYKSRSTSGTWHVYHEDIGAGNVLYLNLGNGSGADPNFLNSTAPSSTLLTLGSSSGANGSGITYVAYCFAEIEGYSKFGSYTGNGSADGTFVYTGFRPAFVLIKRTDAAYSWHLHDTERDSTNPNGLILYPDASIAESGSDTSELIDCLSNGFKLRTTSLAYNAAGGTYIYMAFAENPFKYVNAR